MESHSNIPASKKLSIVSGIFLVASLLLAGSAYADQGATVSAQGTFTDVVTGIEINLNFSAEEDLGEDYGYTKYKLEGYYDAAGTLRAISSCSTRGGAPTSDGSMPLASIECNRNGRQAVSINNCKADIETHAFVHSDVPFVTYSGQTTTEVAIKKTGGKWIVSMSMYTPKSKVTLQGPFTGEVFISNCQ